MAINKIVYGGQTLIDLTADTVEPSKVLKDVTYHGNDGIQHEGTCTYDADTSDADLLVAEALDGKYFYANGAKKKGTMPNIGKQTGSISTKAGTVTISQGYHDGSGSIGISATEQAKIIPSNIRENVTILGVKGEMSVTEGENAEESKTITPSTTQQTVTPSTGYTCLRQVVVNAIPYVESANAYGTTVTIG